MTDEYKLWNVSYSFEVPGDRPGDRHRENYFVVARGAREAILKTEPYLVKVQAFKDLNLSVSDVTCTVRENNGSKIKLPDLSLDEDVGNFILNAIVSADGSRLEFIVHEKKS